MTELALRWCARWAWFVLLLVGASRPPPAAAQTSILIHWSARTDTLTLKPGATVAGGLRRVDVWVFRDSLKALIGCAAVRLVGDSVSWVPVGIRIVGDTARPVLGVIPACQPAFAAMGP